MFEQICFPEYIESINNYFTFKYHRGLEILDKYEDGCWIEISFCGVRLPDTYVTMEDANSALEKFIKRYNNLYDTHDGKGKRILDKIVKRLNKHIIRFNTMCENENIHNKLDMIHNSRIMNTQEIIMDMKYIIGTMLWFSDAETTHNTVFAVDGKKIC